MGDNVIRADCHGGACAVLVVRFSFFVLLFFLRSTLRRKLGETVYAWADHSRLVASTDGTNDEGSVLRYRPRSRQPSLPG